VGLRAEAELVFEAPGDVAPIGVTSDWEWLYFLQLRPNNSDILRVPLDGSGEPEEVVATGDDEPRAACRPTGGSWPIRSRRPTTGRST
jgi:hypothetical protein